jgi:hypothetical protein
MQHTDMGRIVNLPRFRQVRNLPHVAGFLRRAIQDTCVGWVARVTDAKGCATGFANAVRGWVTPSE